MTATRSEPACAELVRRYCSERRLTQAELAELAGISGATISRIVNGLSGPSWHSAQRLANAFDLTGEERVAFLARAGYVDGRLA